MEELKQKAKQYIKAGWSIIPTTADKIPAISSWKEFQTRHATEEEVDKWFENPNIAGIAAICGRINNLTVIDLDLYKDEKVALLGNRLPKTRMSRTGSGGYQAFYKHNPLADGIKDLIHAVELRSEGNYVVIPPSRNRNGEYKWVEENGKEMIDFPLWVLDEKVKNGNTAKWKEIVDGANDGNRNISAAAFIGRLLVSSPVEIWETQWETTKHWNLKNKPPLEERELRTTFVSIANRERRRRLSKEQQPTDKFVSFTEVVERAAEELNNTKAEDIISYGYDFLDDALVGIFKGELVLIGGESGTGKTTFVMNIAKKASKTRRVSMFALEDRVVDYGKKALFFELRKLRIKSKRTAYLWHDFIKNDIKDPEYPEWFELAKEELKNSNLMFLDAESQMTIENLEKLMEQEKNAGSSLMIIDHLHFFDLLSKEQKKSDFIEYVMQKVKFAANRLGISIIMVAHYKKLDGNKPRIDSFKDSVAITQTASTIINLWRDRSEGANIYETTFMIPKTRQPVGEKTIRVKFDMDSFDFEDKKPIIIAGTEMVVAEEAFKEVSNLPF